MALSPLQFTQVQLADPLQLAVSVKGNTYCRQKPLEKDRLELAGRLFNSRIKDVLKDVFKRAIQEIEKTFNIKVEDPMRIRLWTKVFPRPLEILNNLIKYEVATKVLGKFRKENIKPMLINHKNTGGIGDLSNVLENIWERERELIIKNIVDKAIFLKEPLKAEVEHILLKEGVLNNLSKKEKALILEKKPEILWKKEECIPEEYSDPTKETDATELDKSYCEKSLKTDKLRLAEGLIDTSIIPQQRLIEVFERAIGIIEQTFNIEIKDPMREKIWIEISPRPLGILNNLLKYEVVTTVLGDFENMETMLRTPFWHELKEHLHEKGKAIISNIEKKANRFKRPLILEIAQNLLKKGVLNNLSEEEKASILKQKPEIFWKKEECVLQEDSSSHDVKRKIVATAIIAFLLMSVFIKCIDFDRQGIL